VTLVGSVLAALLILSPTASAEVSDPLLREHLFHQVRTMPAGERPKVGLVLSAGSIRGLAHVGVINVLEDAGFPVDVVAGTSMGAVVGSLYVGGLSNEELWKVGSGIRMDSGSNLSKVRLFQLLINDSLMSTEPLEEMLRASFGDVGFHELKKPFACVAMDIRTGEKVIFRDGPLAPAVRASMNLPGLFKPVLYRHRYLVDGGVVDYIPVDAARLLGADWVIASVTEGDFTRRVPKNVLGTLEQVIDIRGSILSRQQRRQADYLIEPDVSKVVYYDVSRAKDVMESGLIEAQERLDGAKESLILYSLPRLWKRWSDQ